MEPRAVAAQIGTDAEDLGVRLVAARRALYEHRSKRIWPGLDDKVLTSWNGLMLAALAEAGQALGRSDYTDAARANAEFLHRTMRRDSGRLLRTWKAGASAKYNAYLEDYAYLADGLLALFEATFESQWLDWAGELADLMLEHFADRDMGGFFDTSNDHERLIHRPKDLQDNAVPSGNAMAAADLLKLSLLSGRGEYWSVAEKSIGSMTKFMSQYPSGFGQWLNAASFMASEPREVALIGSGEDLAPFLEVLRDGYQPFRVVAAAEEGESTVPLLKDRGRIDGKAAAYVCRQFVCEAPVTDPEALRKQLE
jgi:uncharacterized protein YyaL (SSP411 family)